LAGKDGAGGSGMTEENKIIKTIETLFANAARIKHGEVSTTLKIH
jgi:hypothetical protein